jgi:uncharacterized protein YaiL (DUF2058 family)
MSDSLKDQLLALGLAKKKPARKKPRKQPPRKPDGSSADVSLSQAYRIREKEDRREKEQAAARKREQEQQRRQVNKKVRMVVSENAIRDEKADIKRNFLYKGRIRSVLVTAKQLRDVNDGKLGVVYLRGNYHLLPSDKVDEVRGFAPDHVPDLGGSNAEAEESHPVPDDLMW